MGAEDRGRYSWREGNKLCQRDAESAVAAQHTPGKADLMTHGLQNPEVLGGTAWHVASEPYMPAGTGQ